MDTLEKIVKHITTNKLSPQEIYKILSQYLQNACKRAWLRGWMRRSGITRASKYAHKTAAFKCHCLEDELIDFQDVNYSSPLSPDTLICIEGGDFKEAKYLTGGDTIVIKGEKFKLRDVLERDGKKLLKF